jgi:hypothetical protein
MLKKITLAASIALTLASSVAIAGGDSLRDRQNAPACERPAAPNICR